MIVVIDYGMGNVGSILNMLKKIGANACLSAGAEDLLQADCLILPGVGSFDACMHNLRKRGYLDILNQRVLQDGIPILGICLGMQLLFDSSEEGALPGLRWISGRVKRFDFSRTNEKSLKIPHMGWNYVHLCRTSLLFPHSDQKQRFYFVHSYHVSCTNPDDVLTTTQHGVKFTSAVCHKNILGVQFHPEKSHRFGLDFFRKFINWHSE